VSAPGQDAGAAPIELAGDEHDIGYQHGAACREAIQGFLDDRLARLLDEPGGAARRHELLAQAEAYGAFVRRTLPHLAAELDGLAAGAGISPAEATLLQYRRELAPAGAAAPAECSLLALRDGGGEAIVAQNIDLHCAMAPLGRVMRVTPADPRLPSSLVYTFAGLLGFVGINAAGLAIGINFVLAGCWRMGISPYLLVRHLLRFSSAAECMAELHRLDRSSSRCLTICDSATLAMVELTCDEVRVIGGDRLCHTNHYLHPELECRDEMHIFTRNASRRRLKILGERADRLGGEAAPEALFALLSDHSMYPLGLCVHAEGDPERDATVASVVMRPGTGELFVRRGNPCETETRRFSLRTEMPPKRAAGGIAPAEATAVANDR
jgi:hypothetical protein